jgi:hypothetical protein
MLRVIICESHPQDSCPALFCSASTPCARPAAAHLQEADHRAPSLWCKHHTYIETACLHRQPTWSTREASGLHLPEHCIEVRCCYPRFRLDLFLYMSSSTAPHLLELPPALGQQHDVLLQLL